MKYIVSFALTMGIFLSAFSQSKYQYSVDINNIQNDQLAITLKTPEIKQAEVIFSFPKAIPGTYARKDYGRFVVDFAAFDQSGKKMKITKLNANQYRIVNATNLNHITYNVNDTWDEKHSDFVFQPGGSNIEVGDNVVMNNHAFYGYFEGMGQLPFEITVTKPTDFYAATHLDVVHTSEKQDIITAKNYVYLADNPILYARPDTTSFYEGNSKINIAVYSVNHKISSKQIAGYLKPISGALNHFFNGLPVSSYQFLYFFEDPKRGLTNSRNGEGGYGALEHNYSSVYYLPELPFEKDLISMINDVSTHEFLHIQTPLNLHSFEIENFNFTTPVMSQHLWLYEGVTEYFAQLVQVQNRLIDQRAFFKEMRTKINAAQKFGDFSMTEMSTRVMEDEFQEKYSSVYSRGALIGLMLDIDIREKTNGTKTLKKVIAQLSKKYGPNKPFEDAQLFDEIIAASHADVRLFLDKYIAGSAPLPYQEYFSKLGYEYASSKNIDAYSPGKLDLKYDDASQTFVFHSVEQNALKVKNGDIFKSIEGNEINAESLNILWTKYFMENYSYPEVSITVVRNGKEMVLSGKLHTGHYETPNYLAPASVTTPQQLQMMSRLLRE